MPTGSTQAECWGSRTIQCGNSSFSAAHWVGKSLLNLSNPCPQVQTLCFGLLKSPSLEPQVFSQSQTQFSHAVPSLQLPQTIGTKMVFNFPISSNIRCSLRDEPLFYTLLTSGPNKIFHPPSKASWFRDAKFWKEHVLLRSSWLQCSHLGKSQGTDSHKPLGFRNSGLWVNKPWIPVDESSDISMPAFPHFHQLHMF